ncbi:unnamed protein product [Urochloa humidicola]
MYGNPFASPSPSPPPTSPTPALTPSPAAISASRPLPLSAAGRNKAQRWGQDTPPTGKFGGGAPPTSYKQTLLTARPIASRSSASPPPEAPLARPLGSSYARPFPVHRRRDEGWTEVESRRARKERLQAVRGPRRHVPADLRSLCFNYFAPDHRATACKRPPRCFKCQRLGHQAYWCPTSDMSRSTVWRPKDTGSPTVDGGEGIAGVVVVPLPAGATVASDSPPDGAEMVGSGEAQNAGGRRRRHHVRRRRAVVREEASLPPSEDSAPPPLVSEVSMCSSLIR